MGQGAVDEDEIGGGLLELAALRVERTFCRGNQQADDQGGHRSDQARPQFHHILRILVQMMLGQNAAQGHASERAPEDTPEYDTSDRHRTHTHPSIMCSL